MTAEQVTRARVVGVLGGTGEQGRGLAYRLGLAGHRIVIGSRSPEHAAHAAGELARRAPAASFAGGANAEAAVVAEIVIAAMPYAGHHELLAGLADELAGKLVVDCVNPLGFDNRGVSWSPMSDGAYRRRARVDRRVERA